jgi:hypothetical protein
MLMQELLSHVQNHFAGHPVTAQSQFQLANPVLFSATPSFIKCTNGCLTKQG